MKSYDVVGFVYNADVHCVRCARAAWGDGILLGPVDAEDSEGNPVHPIFAGEETASEDYCGDCGEPLLEE